MKKFQFTLIICLLLAGTSSFTITNDWIVLKEKTFELSFPKYPSFQSQRLPSQLGELQMDMHLYDGSIDHDENYLYGLVTSNYPDSLINSDKKDILDKFFRGSIDGMVQNVQGKLMSEKSIELAGFPGREVEIDFQNGLAVILMKSYLVKNTLYILQTITPTAAKNNASVLRFHNSFKLLDPK